MSDTVTFCGLTLSIGPGALVPREETELLARTAIAELSTLPGARVVDVCCGTANLACAIAAHRPEARVWACDLTDGAVTLARKNVEALDLARRVSVHQGDLFAALHDAGLEGTIDAVVCNPPYISTSRLASREDLKDEPREAFDGGPYGLTIHQRVIRDALALLRPGGTLLFEFGAGQERQLELLFQRARAYEPVVMVRDSAGAPRVAAAKKRAS